MPTRYRRVGVVLDPELDDALKRAAPRLHASSQAARLRELAMIGIQALGAQDTRVEEANRALDQLGATPARGALLSTSRRLRKQLHGRADETPSESLEWARGTR